jgi:hypothetical protein
MVNDLLNPSVFVLLPPARRLRHRARARIPPHASARSSSDELGRGGFSPDPLRPFCRLRAGPLLTMKAAELNINFVEYLDAGSRSFDPCASGVRANYLHRTPGDGLLLARPPSSKRCAVESSPSRRLVSATPYRSKNCMPGNGILSGTAFMAYRRSAFNFIGRMKSRRCSHAQPSIQGWAPPR